MSRNLTWSAASPSGLSPHAQSAEAGGARRSSVYGATGHARHINSFVTTEAVESQRAKSGAKVRTSLVKQSPCYLLEFRDTVL